jgi:kynurenine 3-monooxygenase
MAVYGSPLEARPSHRDGEQPVVIVGDGLAGAVLACYLGRAGRRVEVYDRRHDPRQATGERGRSINLALSVRGIHALCELGLADQVLRESVLMRGRMVHHRTGRVAFQPYGKDETECLHSVSRAGLNRQLVEAAARYPSVQLFFGYKCTGLHDEGRVVEFDAAGIQTCQSVTSRAVEAEAVIGADGAHSAVRAWMQRARRFDYEQIYLEHGYKELTIPAGPGGTFRMERNALHIWPRGTYMMIALPNLDGSFTVTLFWPFEGPNSFAALTTEADVLTFFRREFPDAVPLLPALADEFIHHPIGTLLTIRCRPWHFETVVLVGDACHAVVPFLGQGMNAAFEDCTVLCRCLENEKWDWQKAFGRYESLRKRHTDVLADLCIGNFLEMRDRVGHPWFLIRKKMAVILHAIFPNWYMPLYTMIEFTRIPYSDAVWRSRIQTLMVAAVAAITLVAAGVLVWWLG